MKKHKFIVSSAISLTLATIITTCLIYNAYFREPITESEAIAIAKAHFTEKYGDTYFTETYELRVFEFKSPDYFQIWFFDKRYPARLDGNGPEVLIDRRTGKIIGSYFW